jgi:hypothetical protein
VSSGVKVEAELPTAIGGFTLNTGSPNFAVINDPGERGVDELHLAGTQMLSVEGGVSGTTNAFATALIPSASRKVEATATAGFTKLRMLPTDFIALSPGGTDGSVIVIENFSASLTCRATAAVGTSTATGTWQATLRYWKDDNTNDGLAKGSYVSVPLSGSVGSTAPDPLTQLMSGANPLVFDDPDPAKRVYLFDKPGIGEPGYVSGWKSGPLIEPSIDTSGRDSSVELADVIQIVSSPVNPDVAVSNVTANVGAMSCGAVDKRGA